MSEFYHWSWIKYFIIWVYLSVFAHILFSLCFKGFTLNTFQQCDKSFFIYLCISHSKLDIYYVLNSSHSLCCKKTKLWLRCLPTPTDLLFPSCPSLRGVGQLYCTFENAISKRKCVCVRELIKELSDTISCSLIFCGVMDGPLQCFSIKEMLLAAIKNT